MFNTSMPSRENINLERFRDQVLGCWTGKNIGGTLGAPFEGRREMQNVSFYAQDLAGEPAPNDDLDLQLIWLLAVEEQGVWKLNERMLAEYWMNYIVAPWNEYGVGKTNIANGVMPPLSGACNNERWKFSNGAWIRSEIWACLFPGSPDEALHFAWMDSCVDHCGEGIYAELFTTALESAAFVVSDLRELIAIGLSKIPADCRVARAVKLAVAEFDRGGDWRDAREAIVKDSADLGWFQAPANVAFVVLGLLYGQGDFGKSICLATNCGDDTDCTAATTGAILGIMLGRSGIPKNWIEPIGESIKTVAIDPFNASVPRTLNDLTARVIHQAKLAAMSNGTLPRLTDAPSAVSEEYIAKLKDNEIVRTRIWERSSFEMRFAINCNLTLGVEYLDGIELAPGETFRLRFQLYTASADNRIVHVKPVLPDNWCAAPGAVSLISHFRRESDVSIELTAGEFDGPFQYIPLEVRLQDRFCPVTLRLPVQLRGAVTVGVHEPSLGWDELHRLNSVRQFVC